jgi:tetratricopeptide (TPR) repeat protein
MRQLARVLVAVVAIVSASNLAPAQDSGWIGQRVITKWGTVLKVGGRIVDRENFRKKGPGTWYRDLRVYRVERVSGTRLRLEAEDDDVSGWVPVTQVISLDRAVDYFTRAIQFNPRNDNAYLSRGHVWAAKDDYDRAIADYSEVIRIDPRHEVAFYDRAGTWYLKEDYDRALADYGEAIRIDPKYVSAYDDRGWTWRAKGDYDRALADFNTAIRIDPKYLWAYNSRAWLWATCADGRYRDGRRAVESATRACELSLWTKALPLGTLAAAEAEVGHFEEAVKHQEKAMVRYKHKEEREEGQLRLELYRAKKPYRDEPVAK